MKEPSSEQARASSLSRGGRARLTDATSRWLTGGAAVGLIVLLGVIVFDLTDGSLRAWDEFGTYLITGTRWAATPGREIFGALPFIVGTIVTSVLALVLAVPVAIGLAIFLTEVCPRPLRKTLSAFSDVLAAIPSVVYGLWGIFVLTPWMDTVAEPAIQGSVGRIPVVGKLFAGNTNGGDLFTAGVILGVMILPIVTAVAREVLATVPTDLRNGAYALGATRFEMIRGVSLPFVRSGIVGASMLGLGRALGETIAVTMVVGNGIGLGASLFRPGFTIPAIIASEFREATSAGVHRSALVALALILVVISFGFAAIARALVHRTERKLRPAKRPAKVMA